MGRRAWVVVGALLVGGIGAGGAVAPPPATAAPRAEHTPGLTSASDSGLERLRAASRRPLQVHQQRGRVSFVGSKDGRSVVAAPRGSTPATAAQRVLSSYGAAFGLDGRRSQARVTRVLPSAEGSVVRAQQYVDGVPVLGGQVVSTLDDHEGLVFASAATAASAEVPGPVVTESAARRTATTLVARQHRLAPTRLEVSGRGRWVYDPALTHTTDPFGARPVWRFEVRGGPGVRETVLVDTASGHVALHYEDTPGALDRTICDNAGKRTYSSSHAVPGCSDARAVRREGGPSSSISDVNYAYLNLGVAAHAYSVLDGIDLTDLIATKGSTGRNTLMSTVRWCYTDDGCPWRNAFWDGRQVVLGTYFPRADDVVAHEITHGYVERTSDLFPFHESGSINESVADTIGELADHLHPGATDDDSAWVIGEDVPVTGLKRSMADPPAYRQPDRMGSPLYGGHDFLFDSGDVHLNGGVGNKTAYLISQGGTFNGHTVTGIGPEKMGKLYLETIPRLTSGAEYEDLGTTLASTCDLLATGGALTSADCDQVDEAIAATELARQPRNPVASAPEARSQCPVGYTTPTRVLTDDDDTQQFATSFGGLWSRTPDTNLAAFGPTPSWAKSGTSSWFGWDPAPYIAGGRSSSAVLGPFTVPSTGGSLLWFRHAYLMDGYPAELGYPAEYYDGGTVTVQTLDGGSWVTQGSLPFVNPPNRTLYGTSTRAYSGDSHGYGSSAIDLTGLAGRTTRVVFGVTGDNEGTVVGWWIDDIRLNNCTGTGPSAPTGLTAALNGHSVDLHWTAPTNSTALAGYQVRRSDDANPIDVPAGTTSLTVNDLTGTTSVSFSVSGIASDGSIGPSSNYAAVYVPTATIARSAASVRPGADFLISTQVYRRGTTTHLTRVPVELQKRVAGSTTWTVAATGTTDVQGYVRWTRHQYALTAYRIHVLEQPTNFGGYSPAIVIRMR